MNLEKTFNLFICVTSFLDFLFEKRDDDKSAAVVNCSAIALANVVLRYTVLAFMGVTPISCVLVSRLLLRELPDDLRWLPDTHVSIEGIR